MKNIAIILSIYKTAEIDLLSKALESIKNQTYKNIKLFICIDGPVSSNIYELINNFDFNKKIIKNDSALGLAQALNHLIEHVLSDDIFFEYIARMDEDDISLCDRIEKQSIFMDNNLNIVASGCSIVTIDSKGLRLKFRASETNHLQMIERFGYRTPIFHPTAIFRSNLFRNDIRYNISTSIPEDLYIWGELIERGYILGNMPDVLLEYRITNKTAIDRLQSSGCLNLLIFRLKIMSKSGKKIPMNTFLTLCRFLVSLSPPWVKIALYRFYS